jgi:transcriptional regulator with XRE-family HTH domain
MTNSTQSAGLPVGELLREWRQRRRMSQLDLACEAEISPRHMSFLETGRSQPSRDMLLRLAERLEVPLRERNALLHAAGFAPVFPQRPLDDPSFDVVRAAIEQLLTAHEPRPAIAVDRHWNMVAANRMISLMIDGINPALLEPPVNVLRLSLHPEGLAPRIANLAQWRMHLLERLRRQVAATADTGLHELMAELSSYPAPPDAAAHAVDAWNDIAVPFQYISPHGILNFFTTSMVFGTAVDITLSELAVEAFFPADAATDEALRRAASKLGM